MKMRALVLSLIAVLAVSCKQDKKADPKAADPKTAEVKPAETKPAEPATPTPAPADPAPAPAAAGLAAVAIPHAKSALGAEYLTGGQPTEEHLQQAKDAGAKVVVNLRSAGEEKDFATEAQKVESLGMKYVHIPIDGKTGEGLNEENAKKLAELMNEKPMVLHCATGQRVGALIALKAFYVDKASAEDALKLGKDNGLSKPELEKIVTDVMAKSKKG